MILHQLFERVLNKRYFLKVQSMALITFVLLAALIVNGMFLHAYHYKYYDCLL